MASLNNVKCYMKVFLKDYTRMAGGTIMAVVPVKMATGRRRLHLPQLVYDVLVNTLNHTASRLNTVGLSLALFRAFVNTQPALHVFKNLAAPRLVE